MHFVVCCFLSAIISGLYIHLANELPYECRVMQRPLAMTRNFEGTAILAFPFRPSAHLPRFLITE